MKLRAGVGVVCAWLGMTATLQAGMIIVPGEFATTDSSQQNTYPFSQANFRYQTLYEASLFSGAMVFSGIAFRPDGPLSYAADTHFDIQMVLSITPVTPSTMSTTYANNLGAASATVFSGNYHAVLSGTVNPDGTGMFDLSFPFAANFAYDPAQGNLLLDIQMGTHLSEGAFPAFDTYRGSGTLQAARVFGDSALLVGSMDDGGLVAQFVVAELEEQPVGVPEPGTIWLLGGPLGAFLVVRRGKTGILRIKNRA